MSSWARIQYERKQLNKVLRRCKNGEHKKTLERTLRRDERRLRDIPQQ